MTKTLLLTSALFGMAMGAIADPIPPGTRIEVRSNETIDVRGVDNGRIYTGSVANDVVDADGRVKIPRGSQAELIVRRLGQNDLSIDLEAVIVDGHHYSVDSKPTEQTRREGDGDNRNLGENRRTGEYVGGGALFGSIVGAIAGGGKGAAIGALAGGGAGAGAQVLTRGNAVHIPAESILSFRLDRALDVFEDRGTEREGHHYHNNSQY
jgi:hypothetical protein